LTPAAVTRPRALLLAPLVLQIAACRDPTQVTLVLSTDVPCDAWQNATIAVGRPGEVENAQPATKTATCDAAGHLGTIVLVPSGGTSDAFTARIVGGVHRAPETCVAPAYGTGCIVERRALRFLPHTPLSLLVSLSRVCDGVACQPDETCDPRTGACVDSAIDPERCVGAGCDSTALAPGADASPAALDEAGVVGDASADGAPPPDGGADGATVFGDAGPGDPCTASAQCASRCCCDYTPASCDLRHDCGFANACLP
jgi:hypothetical protein